EFLPEVFVRLRRSPALAPLLSVTTGRRDWCRCGTDEVPYRCTLTERGNRTLCLVSLWDRGDPQPLNVARSLGRGTIGDLSSPEGSKFVDGLQTDTAVCGCAASSRRSLARFGSFAEADGLSITTSIAPPRTR